MNYLEEKQKDFEEKEFKYHLENAKELLDEATFQLSYCSDYMPSLEKELDAIYEILGRLEEI